MDLIPFTIYKPSTGEIVNHGRCLTVPAPDDPDLAVLEGEYEYPRHYIVEGAAAPRPEMPAHREGLTVSGIPVPAVVIIDGLCYPVEDGEVTLDLPLPGVYDVRIVAFPYLDWTARVVAS